MWYQDPKTTHFQSISEVQATQNNWKSFKRAKSCELALGVFGMSVTWYLAGIGSIGSSVYEYKLLHPMQNIWDGNAFFEFILEFAPKMKSRSKSISLNRLLLFASILKQVVFCSLSHNISNNFKSSWRWGEKGGQE